MRNMKKWSALLAALLCAALVAGCSLAREDKGAAREDELVGVFVRYLPDGNAEDDFFEYDDQALTDYLRANASQLGSGEIELPEGLTESIHILTDEERDQCILFETFEEENENGPYTSSGSSVGAIFNAVRQHVSVTDEGESIEVSAEVYLDAAYALSGNGRLDIDPVYRRADGLLRVAPDSGFMGLLGGVAKTISAESTTTDAEGKKTGQSIRFEVSVKAQPRVASAVLIEMDESNQPIASREIDLTREELVETVSPETAWVLVEARVIDVDWEGEAREKTTRRLVELEEGQGETTLMLPAAQEGLLALRTLTIK